MSCMSPIERMIEYTVIGTTVLCVVIVPVSYFIIKNIIS